VRGENKMGHGRPKRARSWKRRIEPRKAYSLWRSPLLGGPVRTVARKGPTLFVELFGPEIGVSK
jgi:hypothetical protein